MSSSSRRFQFEQCLGRGSFGEVYRASMTSPAGLRTQVAVKLLRSDIDLHGSAIHRLQDEGRILATLRHPAILTVVDLVKLAGRLALVTELVQGEDLARCMADLPRRALLQALAQVSSGLAVAHEARERDEPLHLVHRDVKPSNVRISQHGQAKLLDFGIARFDASDREVRTASDVVIGSIPYMAPERFIEQTVHASSDVFSLGCCLYEGLAGHKLYGTRRVATISRLALQPETYQAFLDERLESISISNELEQLLRQMLAIDPTRRPTAWKVSADLDTLADTLVGDSLRYWSSKRDWPRNPGSDGPLTGRTLEEGDLADLTASTEFSRPAAGPHIQQSAVHTAPDRPTARPRPDDHGTGTLLEEAWRPHTTEPVPELVEPPSALSELHPVTLAPSPKPGLSVRTLAVLGLLGVVGIGLIAVGSLLFGIAVFFLLQGRL